ncbi:MAG: hypothetical protein ABI644_04770 [Arenimonas sp.]
MNIRSSLAVLALGLASTVAFAATPAATTTAAAKPATVKHHAAMKCKAGETLVKGKCEAAKTDAAKPN